MLQFKTDNSQVNSFPEEDFETSLTPELNLRETQTSSANAREVPAAEQGPASVAATALMLNLASSLCRSQPMAAIPGGVRLASTALDFILDAEEAGLLEPDADKARCYLLFATLTTFDGQLRADAHVIDTEGRLERRNMLRPWLNPHDFGLWLVCPKFRPYHALEIAVHGVSVHEWAPVSCMRTWLAGFDFAESAIGQWRRQGGAY